MWIFPPPAQQFVRDHFILLYGIAIVWTVIAVSFKLWRRKVRGPHFPSRDQVTILFEEKWTSGRSFKSLLTRFGGANNCLRATVTDDELWITLHFPFIVFASNWDLDHRIEKIAITSITRRRKGVTVEFLMSDNQTRKIELRLRNPDTFLSALANTNSADADS